MSEDFRKSTRSMANGSCVEAGNSSRVVLVRDTADRQGPVLRFTPQARAAFTAGISGADL